MGNRKEKLRRHLTEVVRKDTQSIPWPRMILCALGTGAPLLLGAIHEELPFAIFGALTGYLLALNDHLGPLFHRLWVITLTFAILMTGFTVGVVLQDQFPLFLALLSVLVYWLGILSGDGAELERGALFSAIGMIVAHQTPTLSEAGLPLLLGYTSLGFGILFSGVPILHLVYRHTPEPYAGLRESFKKSLTRNREKHIHAASYVLTTLLSIALTHFLAVERGNWVTVTVLLVMRPNRTQSLYKTLQRLIGTVAGVIVTDLVILLTQDAWVILPLIIFCAFCVPWSARRNYGWLAFFSTIMIILLVESAASHIGDFHTPYVRLSATLVGCGLAVLGTALAKALDLLLQSTDSQKKPPTLEE